MKSLFCLLFLFIFIPYSPAHAEDRPKEFQGLSWVTQISKVESLVPKKEPSFANLPRDISEKMKATMRESEERGEKTYLRPTDVLILPGGEIKSIEYVFVKDLLAQGVIYFNDYQQYLNYINTYIRRYGVPDREEVDERTLKHNWYTKNEDEADVTLYFSPLMNAGFISMRCRAFLKNDGKTEAEETDWQLFREDENGKWFYDRLLQHDKDILKVRVKCNLSFQRQEEWRISLKLKIRPRYAISLEEIRCSSKESRILQVDILYGWGPLKSIPKNENWQSIPPDSKAKALYDQVCK
jgi:hypothetical protein